MRRSIVTMLFLLGVFLPATITRADPILGGCQIFPLDNPWNTDISNPNLYPVHPNSANYIANINAHGATKVHPDFGSSDPTYGIPYNIVPASQAAVPVTFDIDDESDPGPYPIPPNAFIEGDPNEEGDHHVIVIQQGNSPGDPCTLYEMWSSEEVGGGTSWNAGSGAIFHLDSNTLRPDTWTSADAAGLPILPGLARCDEANSGDIKHAFRFTVNETQQAHVYPATHDTRGNTGANFPPMGLRFRLKASYDISGFTGQSLAIARALKTYGMILADNGSNWYISGEADAVNPGCWDDENLHDELGTIPGTAFEVISPLSTSAAPARNTYTTGTPTFTWNRVSDAVKYHIQVSGNSAFSGSPLLDTYVNADKLYYGPAASFHNGTYYWRVQACPGAAPTNCGTWSAGELFSIHA